MSLSANSIRVSQEYTMLSRFVRYSMHSDFNASTIIKPRSLRCNIPLESLCRSRLIFLVRRGIGCVGMPIWSKNWFTCVIAPIGPAPFSMYSICPKNYLARSSSNHRTHMSVESLSTLIMDLPHPSLQCTRQWLIIETRLP